MNTALLFIRALVGYVIIGILGIICFIPCVVVAALPERWRYDNRVYYWFTNLFYKGAVFATFLPIKIVGLQNISHDSAIIIANHQSAFDIPLVGSLLNGVPHVWLFLKRYTHYPIFGFVMKRMNIVVDHAGLRRLTGSIYQAADVLKKRSAHIVLFPEGGRFIDGSVHKFFSGFALLAEETQRPVIPIIMLQVNKIYPPGSFLLHPYPITIIVGKPFVFEQGETREDFVQRVYAWYEQQVEQHRGS